MGPWGGFMTGSGENMEYVITPAVIVVGIGGYLGLSLAQGPIGRPLVGSRLHFICWNEHLGR